MPEQELSILIKLKDEATAQLKQLNVELEANAKSWRDNWGAIQHQATQAGMALAAFGGIVTAAFGFAYKASEENRLAIARLTTTLHNLGTEYSSIEASLNGYVEATQKTTGISRSEQLGALDQLLLTTGNYTKAMQLLPLALDLAKAKQMDTTMAALLLGRVAEGNINALNRYGFSMEGVKSSAQALEVIHNKVVGSAQALASPLEKLRAIWADLGQAIGDLVTGPIGAFIGKATEVVGVIKKWIETHPELAKDIALLALAIGLAALITGSLILGTVGLGIALAFLLGPIGLVSGAIGLLIAAGILWILRWNEIKEGWGNIWNEIKLIAKDSINAIIGFLNILLGAIDKVGEFFGQAWNLAIPKIESSWGVHFTLPGKPTSPTPMPSVPSLAPITTFGNYGNLGLTGVMPGGVTVTINNAGSVISNTDLMNQIRQLFIELQNRNTTTGLK